jgi:hypothetical protein
VVRIHPAVPIRLLCCLRIFCAGIFYDSFSEAKGSNQVPRESRVVGKRAHRRLTHPPSELLGTNSTLSQLSPDKEGSFLGLMNRLSGGIGQFGGQSWDGLPLSRL